MISFAVFLCLVAEATFTFSAKFCSMAFIRLVISHFFESEMNFILGRKRASVSTLLVSKMFNTTDIKRFSTELFYYVFFLVFQERFHKVRTLMIFPSVYATELFFIFGIFIKSSCHNSTLYIKTCLRYWKKYAIAEKLRVFFSLVWNFISFKMFFSII